MLEIWQGWRRKVGVVVLAAACGMAGCWGRSLVYHEGPILQQGEHLSYSVMSHESLLFLMRHHDSRTGGAGRPLLQWQCDSLSPRASYVTDMPQLKWIWHLGEFGLRDNSQKTVRITVLVIPYWLPTLTLTTLAASLLLPNPPRPPKPQPDQSFHP